MAKEPEQVELTPHELEALQERIKNFSVTKEDIALFGKVLDFFVWVQSKLIRCQMTIAQLKKIIFGNKTEKNNHSNLKKEKNSPEVNTRAASTSEDSPIENHASSDEGQSINDLSLTTQSPILTKPKVKGHGRIGADEYEPDEIIQVKHVSLKAGDPCPTDCGGKLYQPNDKPGGIIRILGQPCTHVVRYEFDRLRCSLCGETFVAQAPSNFPPQKHDAYFKANLVIQKYFMASPFYRQEQYQKLLGFRLPDSTQWDLIESVADCVYPVVNVLEQMSANGTHASHDDTRVKILDVLRANKLEPDKKRKGMYTTCIFAQAGNYKICLYYSGVKHGGENLSALLEKRDKDLPPIIQMCDALSANVPAALKTILCHCITHGRRKFKDIEPFFPLECGHVIEQLALVYKHDAQTKEQSMTADERLVHHQTYSAPVMKALKIWMQAQLDERKVEPNSALGGAIRYMQKHWIELTKFLSVSGAHLDNNLVERALKLAIRTRKNAMFHKSLHGAYVAGLLLSLIATCELANKNPVQYLIALQENKSAVFKHPALWLPWNYESTLIDWKKNAA